MHRRQIRWMTRGASLCLGAGLVFAVSSCGGSDDDDGDDPKTVYANLAVSDSTSEGDNGSFELTSVATCSLDTESDFLKIVLNGGKSKLILKVQDAAVASFSCTQEIDGFDNCFVYGEVPSENGSDKVNGYSMAVDKDAGTEDVSFTYAGTCSVTLSELEPSVEGSVSCTGMVQTKLNGTARNPIEDNITATFGVPAFNCKPKTI